MPTLTFFKAFSKSNPPMRKGKYNLREWVCKIQLCKTHHEPSIYSHFPKFGGTQNRGKIQYSRLKGLWKSFFNPYIVEKTEDPKAYYGTRNEHCIIRENTKSNSWTFSQFTYLIGSQRKKNSAKICKSSTAPKNQKSFLSFSQIFSLSKHIKGKDPSHPT